MALEDFKTAMSDSSRIKKLQNNIGFYLVFTLCICQDEEWLRVLYLDEGR